MPTRPQTHFGFTAGPPGSSGGLTRNPYQQMAQPTGGWQYGYGTAPGQTNRGYYEQQTPAGSFAAADRVQGPQQQYAQVSGATNPYIGQGSQGIGSQQSVLPYAQQIANAGQQQNPYLGAQTTPVGSAGQNQYMGQNPYLQSSVSSGLQQAADSFQNTVLPRFDSMARQSGSFGNTGVEAARWRAMDQFGRSQADAATNAYLRDYQNTQQLQENALNRNQQVNMTNAGLQQADIARNLGGSFTGQQLGMQGLQSLLGAGQFDANLGQQGGMFNASLADTGLGRNQNLAQQMGQFNAGALNQGSQFNASQGNQMNQYLTGLGQQTNLANAGAANNMLGQVRNLNETGRQFDENLDWNIDQGNWNRMRTGQQDQIALMNQLLGWGNQGIGNATNIYNTPLNYLQQFGNLGATLGGQGGSTSTPLNGNPLLGFLGGWNTYNSMFGG